MAAPIIQQIVLDLRQAEAQLDALQRQIEALDQTVTVPVQVEDSQFEQLQLELSNADDTVNIDVNAPGGEQAVETFNELQGEMQEVSQEADKVKTRAKDLGDELKKSAGLGQRGFQFLKKELLTLGATFGAALGVRALFGQFNAAIDAATELSESINAVNVTFGDGADTVLEFGRNAAQSVGLATSEFNQLVVPLGALLSSFNLDGREAADAANELATRASDLASVFNTDVTDALQAVGSALRGEQEPIRRYGVNLNQAAIDAKALELGLAGVGEEVDIAARGQAAYALILEQTAFAAGDFANTSDEVANRQRILAAETENARAAIGDALLPAYEAILDIAPPLIESLEDIGPLFGLIGEAAAAAVGGIQPFIQVVGEAVGAIGNLVGAVEDVPEGASWLPDLGDLGQVLNPLGLVSGLFLDIQDRLTRGFTDDALADALVGVAEAAERTTDDVGLLTEVFERFSAEGLDIVPFLGEFADAATLTDQELERFLQNLLLSAEILGLTAAQIAGIRALLRETGGDPTGGFGFGAIIDATPAVDAATSALDRFRESQDAVFNQATADAALRDRFGELPTVISDLETLRGAADDAGVSLEEFVNDVPDDVVINVEPALIQIGTLIEGLEEVQRLLGETTAAPEVELDIVYDAEGNVANLTEAVGDVPSIIQQVIDAALDEAEIEADLSEIVLTGAPDVASFIQGQDEAVQAALAEAFALDEGATRDLQAALDGTMEGLAPEAATQLAAALATATPEAVFDLGVFAAQNFVSDAIRGQIGESAGEIANQLEISLGNETIQPEITIDLSLAQITGLNIGGNIPIGDGFGDQPGTGAPPPPPPPGGVQPVANFEVNINNPTTQDLESSSAQAAQTIAAVSSTLWRAN